MSTPDTDNVRRQRHWRQWRIPGKIYGRVRTSTVAFGLCFVLTGLLYGQVSAKIDEQNKIAVQGPTAIDPAELAPVTEPRTYEQTPTTTTTTTTPTATTLPEPSGSVEDTGQRGSSTTVPQTTTAPFGVPLPPVIASLIPTQPAPTSPR